MKEIKLVNVVEFNVNQNEQADFKKLYEESSEDEVII